MPLLRFPARILLAALLPALSVAEPEPIVGPSVFFASDLLPKELCAGERFRVDPIVEVQDFAYVFDIRSDYGDFRAIGAEAVAERVRELRAIARLEEISQTEAFAA